MNIITLSFPTHIICPLLLTARDNICPPILCFPPFGYIPVDTFNTHTNPALLPVYNYILNHITYNSYYLIINIKNTIQ